MGVLLSGGDVGAFPEPAAALPEGGGKVHNGYVLVADKTIRTE
jgi:hypothetical protein